MRSASDIVVVNLEWGSSRHPVLCRLDDATRMLKKDSQAGETESPPPQPVINDEAHEAGQAVKDAVGVDGKQVSQDKVCACDLPVNPAGEKCLPVLHQGRFCEEHISVYPGSVNNVVVKALDESPFQASLRHTSSLFPVYHTVQNLPSAGKHQNAHQSMCRNSLPSE